MTRRCVGRSGPEGTARDSQDLRPRIRRFGRISFGTAPSAVPSDLAQGHPGGSPIWDCPERRVQGGAMDLELAGRLSLDLPPAGSAVTSPRERPGPPT